MTKFINADDLRIIEFGPTSLCNAGCPLCNRHIDGTSTPRPQLTLSSLSYDSFTKIANDLGKHTKHINCTFGGVMGDSMMHPEIESILQISVSRYKSVSMDTNGGMRDTAFWHRIGRLSADNDFEITFSIDGLVDTNAIYRINTNFNKIIDNAQAFISAGGKAIWKFIVFAHNEHQIEEAKQLAKDLGFNKFITHYSKRFNLQSVEVTKDNYQAKINVIDSNVKDNGIILKPSNKVSDKDILLNQSRDIKTQNISCKTINRGQIYIDENNRLWPCCYFNSVSYYSQKWFAYWNVIEEKYGKDFNNLNNTNILDLLQHDYFQNYLPDSWNNYELASCHQCPIKCGNSQYNIKNEDKENL